jgi:hypothetical protein
MRYRVEQRIHTLAENIVDDEAGGEPVFEAEGVTFSLWKETPTDGYWTHQYWLATSEIDGDDFQSAWKTLWNRLARVVPRISLVTQCYIEYLSQPTLIVRNDSHTAFFQYIVDRSAVGLSFMNQEFKALQILLKHAGIPDEFFWYWNDATNSTGYTSKLVLMLAAIETLVNMKDGGGKHKKDWGKIETILGKELTKDFYWGPNGLTDEALRNRLIHGRYFGPQDGEKDHVKLLHKRVVAYFNHEILGEELSRRVWSIPNGIHLAIARWVSLGFNQRADRN